MSIAPHLDDTDPALPVLTQDAFAPTQHTLIVLTRDAQLLETLRNVAGEDPVAAVADESELVNQLLAARSGVALIDAAAAATPITSLAERLKSQFPDLVLVVAGGTEEQGALTPHITRGTVYRFLHKPLSEQRVRLFVAAAWRRHGEEHSGIVGAARTQTTRTVPAVAKRRAVWPAVAVLAAAAAAGGWYLLRSTEAKPEQGPRQALAASARASTPAAADLPNQVEPQDRLAPIDRGPQPPPAAQAQGSQPAQSAERTPVATGTGGGPVGHSPASVPPPVQLTPKPQPARAAAAPVPPPPASAELAERIISEARAALSEGKLEEAERLIQIASAAAVNEDDLDDLTRKATELRIAARGSAITRLSQEFNDRLEQGKLLEPAEDSARHYLEQLTATDPQHPATRMARESFARRALSEARRATDADAAQRWLGIARDAGADDAALAQLEESVKASTQAAATSGPEIVAAASLHKIHNADPQYPSGARARNVEGWVDLELTVHADGSVGDVAVLRSEPAEIFDAAAAKAVAQWRYQAPLRDGTAVDQRTRVRIRFKIQ